MSQKDKEAHLRYIEQKGKYTVACNHIIFTREEIEVLEHYGHWFEALINGTLSPFNTEQEHFIEVAQGTKDPQTPYEEIWRRYLKRKDIEKKAGTALYTRPLPADDTFYSRDMVQQLKNTMFNVMIGNDRKRR